ncbi:UDP-N-acetylmuramoyl-tripeptide--D-alanyl-D-alanine ligase [Noviherbaspirillum sedimenti]|uniref:UDP-N-acetylmuramoyl-tripeptide--D-alanyl-D-alanine ligase n=1 Tax=Noviherbaspirillum sedimenti TaxID=2320865 RepID=A0A3A3G9X2_9BURK|nr:UDP-N-acetylmuramoyl-tripeptide--D-alanyl-D-alanine ligase [Noviherbaspirillum sedimenti]RJG04574.1 UDP-N-acetylmuramoyl-tripeptide--D-alanyl-D-alanine ligase [Noviherbaspirillum sedimenti]
MHGKLAQLQPHLAKARLTQDAAFTGVSTDSRSVAAGKLFVALKGERFDAHDYLEQVAAQGAAAVLVERVPAGFSLPALVVPDTRAALGEMAAWWRRQFVLPVIGVTGSNGKTTVKEMIAAILAAAHGAEHILATRGNLNNDIGVPLTVFRLDANCRAAVIELGMNHPGEIAVLTAIAQPLVGLVNNAQREHQEFMASVAAVAEENGAVIRGLPADGIAVFPADDPFTPLWRGYAGGRRVLGFGFNPEAEVRGEYTPNAFGSDIRITAGAQQFSVKLAAAGEHNVRNALAAAACALAIGIDGETVRRGLEAFAPVDGRLQRKTAVNGALVIDDTYNANPDSVRAAIDVLAQAPAPRLLVLGDMGEVGDQGLQFHQEVGAYAAARGIERLLTLGEMARDASAAFGPGATHFDNIEEINHAAAAGLAPNATVLVKGSRFMKMERVVTHLVSGIAG